MASCLEPDVVCSVLVRSGLNLALSCLNLVYDDLGLANMNIGTLLLHTTPASH